MTDAVPPSAPAARQLDLTGHAGIAAIVNARGQDIDTYFRGFGFSTGRLEAAEAKQAASGALASAVAALTSNPPLPWASVQTSLETFVARLLDLVTAAEAQGQSPLANAVGNHTRIISAETADLASKMAPPAPPPAAATAYVQAPAAPAAAPGAPAPYVPADAAYTPGAAAYPGQPAAPAEGGGAAAPAAEGGAPPGYAPPPPGYAPPGYAPPGYAPPPPGYAPPPPGYAPPGYAPPPPGYAPPPPGYAPPGYAPPPPGYAPAPPGAAPAGPDAATLAQLRAQPHPDVSNYPITVAICHANGEDIHGFLRTYGVSLMHLDAVNEEAACSAALAMAAQACGGLREGPGTGDQPPAPWDECLGALHGFANSLAGLLPVAHAQNQYTLEPVIQNMVNDLNTELHKMGSPFHHTFGGGPGGGGPGGGHHLFGHHHQL